jgi:hypothetical protein
MSVTKLTAVAGANRATRARGIRPREYLVATGIPDATPEIIASYAQSEKQELLAKVRHNPLIDVFLEITCCSLQSHFRTASGVWGRSRSTRFTWG